MEDPDAKPPKREYGTGSIRFWRGIWWAAVQLQSGKRVVRRRRTREDAEAALRQLMVEYDDQLGYYYHMPRPYYYGSRPKPPGELTASQRFRVLERDGFRCRYCGAPAPDVRLTVDHVESTADGGSDDDDNLVAACWPCNQGKSRRSLAVEAVPALSVTVSA